MKKVLLTTICLLICILSICGCKNTRYPHRGEYYQNTQSTFYDDSGILYNESYLSVVENKFIDPLYTPQSYFSMDSFTAAYSNLRRYIVNKQKINKNIILTDELINYFDYNFKAPTDSNTFSFYSEMHQAPWNNEHKLLTIAVKAKDAQVDLSKGNNYVFLIDVSGSMNSDNKLDLIKKTFKLLLNQLSKTDTVSIVTYANGVKTHTNGLSAKNKKLVHIMNGLKARGGTNGSSGIDEAYKVAQKNFIEGGNNRIILATDGDFNIGSSSMEDLQKQISVKKESGVYLTCLGFGMGNYRSTTMETLAKCGNGGYHYIDTIEEAKKVFINDFTKTMTVVSKDTKTCVEFNEDVVEAYRLIGYENKLISEDDFNDETKDAGEIGSGNTSVVCYELILKENTTSNNLAEIKINYKDPLTDISKQEGKIIENIEHNITSEDYTFVSNVAMFSLLIRNSAYAKQGTYQDIINNLSNLTCVNNDTFKKEFLELVKIARDNNLVAEQDYDKYRLIILYGINNVEYLKFEKGTSITSKVLCDKLEISEVSRPNVTFYLKYEDDFSDELTSFVLNDNTNVYVKYEKK